MRCIQGVAEDMEDNLDELRARYRRERSLMWRVFGPSLRLIWAEREMLLRAAWFRVHHPRAWAEARREVGL